MGFALGDGVSFCMPPSVFQEFSWGFFAVLPLNRLLIVKIWKPTNGFARVWLDKFWLCPIYPGIIKLVIDKLRQIVNCYSSGFCPHRCIYVHVISLIWMNGQAMGGDQKMKWFFAIFCLKLNHIALSCTSALWIDLSNKLKKKQIRADKFCKGRLHLTLISGAFFTGYSDSL